jgi:hypothetical protein
MNASRKLPLATATEDDVGPVAPLPAGDVADDRVGVLPYRKGYQASLHRL